MSSKSIKEGFVEIEYEEEDFNLKRVVIPFSLFFLKDEKYIYNGSEEIPFKERDPLYKTILLHEFTDSIRNMKKRLL